MTIDSIASQADAIWEMLGRHYVNTVEFQVVTDLNTVLPDNSKASQWFDPAVERSGTALAYLAGVHMVIHDPTTKKICQKIFLCIKPEAVGKIDMDDCIVVLCHELGHVLLFQDLFVSDHGLYNIFCKYSASYAFAKEVEAWAKGCRIMMCSPFYDEDLYVKFVSARKVALQQWVNKII